MTDFSGLAQVLTAAGVLLAAVFAGIAAIVAAMAKRQSMSTHLAVNSRMDEFKRLFEEKFIALGELKEKTAEEGRKAAVTVALGGVSDGAISQAEEKAKALIADATRAAALLISEAHRVAVTNKPSEPIPVQVVGPGVDTPLKVVTDKRGRPL